VAKEFNDRRTITIDHEGTIFLGVRPSEKEEIKPIVKKAKAQLPMLKIFLRADKRVEHKVVRDVMKECAAAGATEIIFATHEK
jgi:biopolymer transport protein ExbD